MRCCSVFGSLTSSPSLSSFVEFDKTVQSEKEIETTDSHQQKHRTTGHNVINLIVGDDSRCPTKWVGVIRLAQ